MFAPSNMSVRPWNLISFYMLLSDFTAEPLTDRSV